MRLFFYSIVLINILLLEACSDSNNQSKSNSPSYYFQTTGHAQGTTYNVIYKDEKERDLSTTVDSILKAFDQELSIYVDSSTISQINKLPGDTSLQLINQPLFEECFRLAKEVYHKTNYAFNPAIYPLVKYWGFLNFEQGDQEHQQTKIDSLLRMIDFSDSAITILPGDNYNIIQKNKTASFDFNAIAQGYSVDVIASYLNKLGIEHYMVEVGGELKTKGNNSKGSTWKIGIDQPIENSKPGEKEFQIIAGLNNSALATSGNYRKFYEKDGVKYSHTIDPNTGKPVQHQLLSATVITDNCALADAYATAFMVMGTAQSKTFIQNNPDLHLSVYLISSDSTGKWTTWQTEDFQNFIVE
ncbi:MAG: FAD:protein FMN transferase [Flavobacteriales bacterium]|jgi:thiamine biosynthesis lipoprotein|nr:FAD:protein FMN transferase [Flavobacteriales bacterium]